MPAGPRYAEGDIDAAVERLMEGTRLQDAEARVAAAAPALQRVLTEALAAGGWFEGPHRQELERVAAIEDPGERLTAVSTLLAEETRIAMMVGVAVGWAVADELDATSPEAGGFLLIAEGPVSAAGVAPLNAGARGELCRPRGVEHLVHGGAGAGWRGEQIAQLAGVVTEVVEL